MQGAKFASFGACALAALAVAALTDLSGADAAAVQLAQAAPDQATLMREGQPEYVKNCRPCHGANGQGDAGPKLAGNDVVGSKGGLIGIIFVGAEDHGMPPFYDTLNDRQVAAIATYVRNSWGNAYGPLVPAEVAASRR